MIQRAHDLVASRWGARFLGRRFCCAIGKGGLRADKREGDGASPVGAYAVREVYYRPDRGLAPKLHASPVRPLRLAMGWSDDTADPCYNTLVARPHPFTCEALWRADPLYDLIATTSHNRDPAIPGRGSAIFLHVWRRPRWPTEGCIAFRKSDLLWILAHLRRDSRLVILDQSGARAPKTADPTRT